MLCFFLLFLLDREMKPCETARQPESVEHLSGVVVTNMGEPPLSFRHHKKANFQNHLYGSTHFFLCKVKEAEEKMHWLLSFQSLVLLK